MALEPGQIIDNKYRIVRLIGEGGMGAVYEGENTRIRRRVAIKVLHAATAANAEVVTRFEREAQAAGTIGNDHILEVLDLGALPNGDRYMVMEFLDGEPLSSRISRLGRLTPSQLTPLIRQTLEALGAAHAAGIYHRDLKPDNIFILKHKAGRADYVKLIDFGISKFTEHGGGTVTNMTRAGAIMGTPYYMSPEQANGSAEADHRSDLYAIGVVMYEAITGVVPFDAKTFNELLFQIVLQDPVPPQQRVPELDPHYAAIVVRAMNRTPKDRFQNAAEFDSALEHWSRGRPKSFPPVPGTTAYNVQGQGIIQAPTPAGRPPVLTPTPYDQQVAQPMHPGAMVTQAETSGANVFSSSQPQWSGPPGPMSQSQPGSQQFSQSQPQQDLARGTQNEWNRSAASMPAPVPPKRGGAVAFAVIFAVLVLGGGAFAATRIFGGEGKSDKPNAAANGADESNAKPKTDEGSKDDPSESKDKDKSDKGSTDDGDKTAKDKDDDKGNDKPAPEATTAPPVASASIAPTVTASATVAIKPTATTKPTTKPTAAPTTKPTSAATAASTGKKPTGGSTPDFGY